MFSITDIINGYKRARQHSKMQEDWKGRLGELLLNMISDATLPNVVLGGFITSVIANHVGVAPNALVFWWFVALLGSFALYAVGDEIRLILKSISEEVQEVEDSDRTYQ